MDRRSFLARVAAVAAGVAVGLPLVGQAVAKSKWAGIYTGEIGSIYGVRVYHTDPMKWTAVPPPLGPGRHLYFVPGGPPIPDDLPLLDRRGV